MDNGKVTGTLQRPDEELRIFDIDWVWDTSPGIGTYCRSGFSGDSVLDYECEYIDIIPDAGVRFTYLDGEGAGAGAIEYWAFEAVN